MLIHASSGPCFKHAKDCKQLLLMSRAVFKRKELRDKRSLIVGFQLYRRGSMLPLRTSIEGLTARKSQPRFVHLTDHLGGIGSFGVKIKESSGLPFCWTFFYLNCFKGYLRISGGACRGLVGIDPVLVTTWSPVSVALDSGVYIIGIV